jgi:hypothetical protein
MAKAIEESPATTTMTTITTTSSTTTMNKSSIAQMVDVFLAHVDIRDRRHCAILYKDCFIGS